MRYHGGAPETEHKEFPSEYNDSNFQIFAELDLFTQACSKGNAICILISSYTMLSSRTGFWGELPNMTREGCREMCSSTSRVSVAGTVFLIVALQAQLGRRVALCSSHKDFSWLETKSLKNLFPSPQFWQIKDLSGVHLPFWILLLRRDKRKWPLQKFHFQIPVT